MLVVGALLVLKAFNENGGKDDWEWGRMTAHGG